MSPDAPDVVGVAGACVILGVSRQRLAVLRKRPGFPPCTFLENGRHPCWYRQALEDWKAQR